MILCRSLELFPKILSCIALCNSVPLQPGEFLLSQRLVCCVGRRYAVTVLDGLL